MTLGSVKPPSHQLGFGNEISADARALPHRIGREREDVEPGVDEPVRKGAADLAVHLGHDGRSGVEIHELTERHDAASSEVAAEQRERGIALRVDGLAHQHRREVDARAGSRRPPAPALRPSRRMCRSGCIAARPVWRRTMSSCGNHAPSLPTDPPDNKREHATSPPERYRRTARASGRESTASASAPPSAEDCRPADREASVPRKECFRAQLRRRCET